MNHPLSLFDPNDNPPNEGGEPLPIPPECRGTVDLLQRVMDGIEPPSVLSEAVHPQQCLNCRERAQAALLVLAALAEPVWPTEPCADLTSSIVSAVAADRRMRRRRRWAGAALGTAVAAAVLLAVFVRPNLPTTPTTPAKPEIVRAPDHSAPAPPVRIGEALADAGDALENIGRHFAESPVDAPPVLTPLADALCRPPAQSLAANLEPAARTLCELPETALISLEPVTGPAARAFSRLIQDVTAVQPAPKSKGEPTKS